MPDCNLGHDFTEEMAWLDFQQALDAGLNQPHQSLAKEPVMPNISQMMPSKYLKKEDFPVPALVTIRSFSHDNVAQQGQPEEKKWVMHFNEFEAGMVMNPTNLQLAAAALGSEETDDWIGRQIVVYNDPNVSFGGRLTGGLRVRQVRVRQPAPAAARPTYQPPPTPVNHAPAAAFADMDDDIPF